MRLIIDAASADPGLLGPNETEEMHAMADRLDAELNLMLAKRMSATKRITGNKMVHIELTEVCNASTADFSGEAPITAKILIDLTLIATVTDSEIELDRGAKGARLELRAAGGEPRRTIEVSESYTAIRALIGAHSTIVTV
ncbi:hypothetical protein ACN9MZ_26120 [Pseudoduganella sp. S-14]|uniref:hypothetical protein n=1 Tax=Pseudoduganella sp. S-14 TaxID=3404065 RepID=UPI003CF07DA3